jgi:signal transduction histidine kinase
MYQATDTLLAIGALGLLVALFAVQQRQSNLRARLAELLADENARLESVVSHRTRELTSLATYLTNAGEAEARLARELHDKLGALLTAAKMDAGWLKRTLAESAERGIKDRFKRLIDTIGSGITVKRRIIDDLRPPLLPDRDLDLNEEHSLALFRIAQEALTNIRKNAHANRVELGLKVDGGQIHLWVEDDGVGFHMDAPQFNRHGLAGMQHRVQMFAGGLSIRSSPGNETRIEARMPLPSGTPQSS